MHGKKDFFFGKIKSRKWSWEASLKKKKGKSKDKRKKRSGMRGFPMSCMGKRRGAISKMGKRGFQERI